MKCDQKTGGVAAPQSPAGAAASPWRVLVDVTQSQRKGAKEDLTAHFAALQGHPACSGLVDILTAPEVDEAALRAVAQVVGARIEDSTEDGVTVVWIPLPAHGCPEELGGPAASGERARWARVTARHAAWRDRRVRRLAAVQVVAG